MFERFLRLEKFQKKIKRSEAYLITDASNISYLSNFTGTNGQVFLTKEKSYLLTDFRYFRSAKKVLPKKMSLIKAKKDLIESLKKLIARAGTKILYFEEKNLSYFKYRTLRKELNKIKLKPQLDFVENFRMVKDEQEIEYIIKAQRIAEKAFTEIHRHLKPGKTELQVARQIIELAYKFGADDVSFPPIIAFGSNSGYPHHLSGNRKLKKGDLVLIDIGMKYKGYCSDMTRMVFTATPTQLQQNIYNIVLKAQESTIKKLKAGVTGIDADNFARAIIKKAGYGKNFGHSLGHSIGLQIHELPSLSNHYSYPIPENSVVTVEPGIYLEKSFGVRIEDMVLVKGKNTVVITKIPKDIEHSIIKIN